MTSIFPKQIQTKPEAGFPQRGWMDVVEEERGIEGVMLRTGRAKVGHRLADVLSTQSIKAPEVVNGISESMATRNYG